MFGLHPLRRSPPDCNREADERRLANQRRPVGEAARPCRRSWPTGASRQHAGVAIFVDVKVVFYPAVSPSMTFCPFPVLGS